MLSEQPDLVIVVSSPHILAEPAGVAQASPLMN